MKKHKHKLKPIENINDFKCSCGVEEKHFHDLNTNEIAGFITTLGGKGSDIEISEEEEYLLFEQMFTKQKPKKLKN